MVIGCCVVIPRMGCLERVLVNFGAHHVAFLIMGPARPNQSRSHGLAHTHTHAYCVVVVVVIVVVVAIIVVVVVVLVLIQVLVTKASVISLLFVFR